MKARRPAASGLRGEAALPASFVVAEVLVQCPAVAEGVAVRVVCAGAGEAAVFVAVGPARAQKRSVQLASGEGFVVKAGPLKQQLAGPVVQSRAEARGSVRKRLGVVPRHDGVHHGAVEECCFPTPPSGVRAERGRGPVALGCCRRQRIRSLVK